jgi:hypothetical protein
MTNHMHLIVKARGNLNPTSRPRCARKTCGAGGQIMR